MNSTEALVDDYLRRLERAAYALPPERRAELVLEIRGHIAEARDSAAGPTDEAWTRTLLDRLGTPEEIVAAAEQISDPTPRPPGSWEPIVRRFVLGVLWFGLTASAVGALDAPNTNSWIGVGRLFLLVGAAAAWPTPGWDRAAAWSLSVVTMAFCVLWAVLAHFPPLKYGADSDPVWWHWQVAFLVVGGLYAAILLVLWIDVRATRVSFRMRELTALLLIAAGWWVGILPAVVAMVVAWRSRGLVPWARWVGLAILLPAIVAWLTIPLGLAQRVNQRGFFDESTAWVVTLGCSFVLFAWLCFRFFRARLEVPS